ncbi:MAG: N-acetyltransferase [Pseudomonadota bacterium]
MNTSSHRLRPRNDQALRIVPVSDRRARRRFIRMPWPIYEGDPAWTPPLLIERSQHISPRNPVFAHVRWQAWLAYRGSRLVGRISAQIDQLHLDRYRDATGFFGMLEAEDDAAVFHLLMKTAASWLKQQGMRCVMGPFNLSINEECGLLVEGFDTPPSLMMGHARPYYGARIEEQGYTQAKDLLAYLIRPDFDRPAVMKALVKAAEAKARVRPLRRSHLKEDLAILRDIFNDAWSENWHFVPFTEQEFEDIGRSLVMLAHEDFVQIAEIDREPVAMIVILPNINEAIHDLNGRLFPIGWAKLLWRLKVAYPRAARIPLMGVRKRFQHSRLGPGLAFLVINALREPVIRRGIQDVEMSWILEDNAGMRNIIEIIGGVAYKRYRIYQKSIWEGIEREVPGISRV